MTKRFLETKNVDGKEFFYVDMGHGHHGKNDFRLWVNKRLVKFDENNRPYISFPIKGARLEYGKSDYTVKLLPSDGMNVFDVFVECGYRGSSFFKVDEPKDRIFNYVVYRSETGSLGVSDGALVVSDKDKLVIEWEKTGRLYGSPSKGKYIIELDGTETDLGEIELDELSDLE